jgi:hypothetical protein
LAHRLAAWAGLEPKARQWKLVLLDRAGDLAVSGDPLELLDRSLSFDPNGIIWSKRIDQARDPIAELKGEVRRGRPHELPDVFHGHDMVRGKAVGPFATAH